MNHNLRIIISLTIAFLVVNLYSRISSSPFITQIQAENIKGLLLNLRFPTFNLTKLFTLKYNSSNTKSVDKTDKNYSFNLPTAPITPVVSNSTYFQPSPEPSNTPYPTDSVIFIPTKSPTSTPKPTKAPNVFPIDPSLARPGKTPDEVFKIASEKTCVPKEVLKGIAYIESGGFFDVVSPKYFLLYNSYDWWNSEFLTEEKRICGGYGYDQNTGIVPEDSKFAGYKCKEGYNSGLNVMGVMSVSSYEQSKYAKKVANLLGVKSADRRVILDALMIVGLITKDNVKPASCTNWTGQQVAKAACGYYGSCGFKDGTYYCNTFCRNYKKFGGKTDCQGAVNKMQDNCWQ